MNTETQNYESERKILDSGSRRQFDSGAVRDIAVGKGRCDLLPLDVVAELIGGFGDCNDGSKNSIVSNVLSLVNNFIRGGGPEAIRVAILEFSNHAYSHMSTTLLELSKHYEEGAKKYAERNWEKGIPAHCYVDSGVRHLIKWADNWDDEPHDRAFLWNMFGLLWTIKHHPELNDLPYMTPENEPGYVVSNTKLPKDVYKRLSNDDYSKNPMEAVEDVNTLMEAFEKGVISHG